jgi:uncharacterized membrane protein
VVTCSHLRDCERLTVSRDEELGRQGTPNSLWNALFPVGGFGLGIMMMVMIVIIIIIIIVMIIIIIINSYCDREKTR